MSVRRRRSSSSSGCGFLWLIFVSLKLAGVPGIVAWSWWWVLLPPIPLITEFVKVLMRQ